MNRQQILQELKAHNVNINDSAIPQLNVEQLQMILEAHLRFEASVRQCCPGYVPLEA